MKTEAIVNVIDTRIPRRRGGHLHVHSRHVSNAGEKPVVVLSHGFVTSGVENHRLFMRVARALNASGYSITMFDYFGCGYSDGDYEEFLLSEAAEDLETVATWSACSATCNGSAILFGQSLGTAACVWACTRGLLSVTKMVLWNLTGRIGKRYEKLYGLQREAGEPTCVMPKGDFVGTAFLRDASSFDVALEVSRVTVPVMFLNCAGDSKGDMRLTDLAVKVCKGPTYRKVLALATHSFIGQRDLEREAIEASVAWLAGREVCS